MASKACQKRKRNESVISGLTNSIIRDLATEDSFSEGCDLFDDGSVRIYSHSEHDNIIEAMILGKNYEVSISYENPLRSGLGISANCSCLDDQDGTCKHVIAVLFAVIDDRPQPKKKKSKANKNENEKYPKPKENSVSELKVGIKSMKHFQLIDLVYSALEYKDVQKTVRAMLIKTNKKAEKYSLFELKEAIRSMEKDELTEIIGEALKYKDIENTVAEKLSQITDKEIDLSDYKAEIHHALHQLDKLKPSQQLMRSHKVTRDLSGVIEAARNHYNAGNGNGAIQILLILAESTFEKKGNYPIPKAVWKAPVPKAVWKALHYDGSDFDHRIASLMSEIFGSDKQMQVNQRMQKMVAKIHHMMWPCGIKVYQDVLDCFSAQ